MKRFLRYTSLSVLGTLGISCYILADTFFVSRALGAVGLAALNIGIPVYSFIHGCGLMLGMGGGTRYTILRSQRENRRAQAVFAHALGMLALFAAAFVMLGLTVSRELTALIGADGETLDMAAAYVRMLLLFSPLFLLNDTVLCFVRNDGAPQLAMLGMLGGSFANIVLDWVFMFPLKMGIFGAVLATGLAPGISLLILSPHWAGRKCGFRPVRTGLRMRTVGSVLALGVPSLLAQVSSGVVMIVMNLLMFGLEGNVGVAAYGVIANLALVVTGVYTGIADGAQPLLSEDCGRVDRAGTERTLRRALGAVIGLSAVIYAALFLFADPVAAIFNSERNLRLQELARTGIRLYFPSGFLAGTNIVLAAYFAAVEKAAPAQAISLLRGLVAVIPVTFGLSALAGVTGVWLSAAATEALTLTAALACLYYQTPGRMRKRVRDA